MLTTFLAQTNAGPRCNATKEFFEKSLRIKQWHCDPNPRDGWRLASGGSEGLIWLPACPVFKKRQDQFKKGEEAAAAGGLLYFLMAAVTSSDLY
jgi:hypothetical protein